MSKSPDHHQFSALIEFRQQDCSEKTKEDEYRCIRANCISRLVSSIILIFCLDNLKYDAVSSYNQLSVPWLLINEKKYTSVIIDGQLYENSDHAVLCDIFIVYDLFLLRRREIGKRKFSKEQPSPNRSIDKSKRNCNYFRSESEKREHSIHLRRGSLVIGHIQIDGHI